MVKKQTNYRLSDEARLIISEQSSRKGMSETAFIEMIVREHRSSNKEENQRRRDNEWKKYRDNSFILKALHENAPGNRPVLDILDARRIFFAGYNSGWIAFQLRHLSQEEIDTNTREPQ